MTVDPKVHALAEAFVDDLPYERLDDPNCAELRDRLIERVASAMQQAVEDECTAIEEELDARAAR